MAAKRFAEQRARLSKLAPQRIFAAVCSAAWNRWCTFRRSTTRENAQYVQGLLWGQSRRFSRALQPVQNPAAAPQGRAGLRRPVALALLAGCACLGFESVAALLGLLGGVCGVQDNEPGSALPGFHRGGRQVGHPTSPCGRHRGLCKTSICAVPVAAGQTLASGACERGGRSAARAEEATVEYPGGFEAYVVCDCFLFWVPRFCCSACVSV
jgi:hypothetical protein